MHITVMCVKKLSQISTASNPQKHLGARGPTYPRGRSWLSAALTGCLVFFLNFKQLIDYSQQFMIFLILMISLNDENLNLVI